MSRVINLILSHQKTANIANMLRYWSNYVPNESLVIAYGGNDMREFENIQHEQKFFVHAPRLRTRDHQRELQSYTGLYQEAAKFFGARSMEFEFLHFAEYDHIPLTTDLNQKQIDRLLLERADLVGFHLHRVDATNDPHFLYHLANPDFMKYWAQLSRRTASDVVFSMFGSGTFWRREAFSAVASMEEPFPIYLEIYLPTLAHYLGFRVRDFSDQNRFVTVLKDETASIQNARQKGAWTLHPVKYLWDA